MILELYIHMHVHMHFKENTYQVQDNITRLRIRGVLLKLIHCEGETHIELYYNVYVIVFRRIVSKSRVTNPK